MTTQEDYNTREAAEILGTTVRTLYGWMKKGIIKGKQAERWGRIRFSRAEVEKLQAKIEKGTFQVRKSPGGDPLREEMAALVRFYRERCEAGKDPQFITGFDIRITV